MRPMPLSRLADAAGGRLVGADAAHDVLIDAVSTDTRGLDPGDGRAVLFVALRGERFDGHDHAQAALEGGARALLVARQLEVALPQVVVADTQRALAALAASLQRARNGRARVVGITGSNGKTTVKALVLSILSRCGKAYANPGNYNNEIGLPLAVIDAPEDADCAIYEMGAGKPGDIAYLTTVVRPDVSVVNNIAPAHLERMDSLFGVADTKAAIYDALPAGGTAVINADDAFAPYFAERAHGRQLLRFGIEASADVTARDIRPGPDGTRFVLVAPQGEAEVALALPGRHNVRNALAAASLALAAGASLDAVREGLAAARPVAGRLVSHRLPGGATLIDDSYNANPGSLHAAIDLLAAGAGEAWLVLGDMRELGADAAALHAEAGRRAKAAGIARLYALGELSAHAAEAFGERGRAFDGHDALAQALREDLSGRGDVRLLVKGSHGSRMDRIVNALLQGAGRTRGEGTDAA
jgi:UDP-N-acetylmuramoyl-tripeptide--D-alanyl-D-alanine ligase